MDQLERVESTASEATDYGEHGAGLRRTNSTQYNENNNDNQRPRTIKVSTFSFTFISNFLQKKKQIFFFHSKSIETRKCCL